MGLFTRDNLYNVKGQGEERKVLGEVLERSRSNLEEQRKIFDAYQNLLKQYLSKLEEMELTEKDQMASVQMALDLTYIKEELETLKISQDKFKAERFSLLEEKVNELSEKLENRNQLLCDDIKRENIDTREDIVRYFKSIESTIDEKNKNLKIGMWFSLFFSVICTGGVVFLILYIL